MTSKASSIDAIIAALPEVQRAIAAEVAARIDAGEAIAGDHEPAERTHFMRLPLENLMSDVPQQQQDTSSPGSRSAA